MGGDAGGTRVIAAQADHAGQLVAQLYG